MHPGLEENKKFPKIASRQEAGCEGEGGGGEGILPIVKGVNFLNPVNFLCNFRGSKVFLGKILPKDKLTYTGNRAKSSAFDAVLSR